MYAGLERGRYFTNEMSDEINNALKNIDEQIDSKEVPPLLPKLNVNEYISNTNDTAFTDKSYKIGHKVHIDIEWKPTTDTSINGETFLFSLRYDCPADLITNAYLNDTVNNLRVYVIGNNVYIQKYGTTISAGSTVYIGFDYITFSS